MSEERFRKYIRVLLSNDNDRSLTEAERSLASAGWKVESIEGITRESPLVSGGVAPFLSPASSQKERHSMVQISVNFFSFILLWVVTFATGMLYFGVINEYFPDPLIQEYFDYASIYYPMAAVIVALPVYIWTMWFWFRG